MGRKQPLTREGFAAWLAGGAVLIVVAGWAFGSSVVSRAEASAERVEDRVEQRLTRIEQKVDEAPAKTVELLKAAGVVP